MVTVIHLLRHGTHDLLGGAGAVPRLAGRMPGVRLNEAGIAQAEALAGWAVGEGIDWLGASPLARTRQTADVVSARLGLPVEIVDGMIEVDFGEWTGRSMEELEGDPRWRLFNERRSLAAPPGGESLLEVQARALRALLELRSRHAGRRLAVASHGDVIRGLVMHVLGMPLDHIHRLEVEPGSVTTLRCWEGHVALVALNLRPAPAR